MPLKICTNGILARTDCVPFYHSESLVLPSTSWLIRNIYSAIDVSEIPTEPHARAWLGARQLFTFLAAVLVLTGNSSSCCYFGARNWGTELPHFLILLVYISSRWLGMARRKRGWSKAMNQSSFDSGVGVGKTPLCGFACAPFPCPPLHRVQRPSSGCSGPRATPHPRLSASAPDGSPRHRRRVPPSRGHVPSLTFPVNGRK